MGHNNAVLFDKANFSFEIAEASKMPRAFMSLKLNLKKAVGMVINGNTLKLSPVSSS